MISGVHCEGYFLLPLLTTKTMRNFLTCAFLLFFTPLVLADDTAETKAANWLKGLGDKGLVVVETPKEEESGFAAKHGRSPFGPVTKFSYQKPGWWVTITFKGKYTKDTPIKTLQKNFWYATIDKMPTPGLAVKGWEIKPQTPTSSFSKGVELVEYAKGKMKVAIKTKAFALYGRDTTLLVPADAPSPKGSYFQIRQAIPIDLTITAPVKFE